MRKSGVAHKVGLLGSSKLNLANTEFQILFLRTSFFLPSYCQLPSFHLLTPNILDPSLTPLSPFKPHISSVSKSHKFYVQKTSRSQPLLTASSSIILRWWKSLPAWLSASAPVPTLCSQNNGQSGVCYTQVRRCHSSPR